MNRLKKAIADLRMYLGRDEHGIAKLDALTRLVNDTRKQLATETEHRERLVEAADRQSETLATLRQELGDTQQELKRAKDQGEQWLRDATNWRSEYEKTIEPKEIVEKTTNNLKDLKRLKQMLKSVRQRHRLCPKPSWVSSHNGEKVYSYKITDVVTGLSPKELMDLGEFVAVAVQLSPAAVCIEKDGDMHKEFPEVDNEYYGMFVRWFRKNLDVRDDNERLQAKAGEKKQLEERGFVDIGAKE